MPLHFIAGFNYSVLLSCSSFGPTYSKPFGKEKSTYPCTLTSNVSNGKTFVSQAFFQLSSLDLSHVYFVTFSYSLSEILPLDNHSWLTCLAVLGSSISRSLCLTVRAYRAIIRVILACHFPKMFLFHHCFQDSARNKDMGEREDERSD